MKNYYCFAICYIDEIYQNPSYLLYVEKKLYFHDDLYAILSFP